MLPFSVELRPGLPVFEQVVYAVKKAVISGVMMPGDRFPSVRLLSQELRINPNTAHKAVAALVAEKILEVYPGVGTVIGAIPAATSRQRGELLGGEIERLVVEAKKLRLEIGDVHSAIDEHWKRLS